MDELMIVSKMSTMDLVLLFFSFRSSLMRVVLKDLPNIYSLIITNIFLQNLENLYFTGNT